MFLKKSLNLLSNNSRYYTTSTSKSGVANILGKVGIGRLNHVAIATPNLKESCDLYRNVLGAKVSEPVDQVEHGVTTVFVDLGNTKIELLHPIGENSPIQNFLKKNTSGGIHHVCIEVDDINHAVKTLLDENIRIIDPKPKIGAHGKPVVFLHPKSMNGVLVELEEK
ncbi:methylmalonyl-CoA epimerase [Tieghemostelium lacteum]|uniref:Methylmalonyl-CoA epimerase, mitochondrial n=1 Tax=Tieghemostelium lacteum TaxID=361077 RepID=A0A151ZIF1_TIELA|nr:methylmalonyl-CoA epimerase [Tieghemostelium lacteum]|eukprot:KYQ93624.1 methylmalonyl-CoA epimerase [Tieghemostelium lacteum]